MAIFIKIGVDKIFRLGKKIKRSEFKFGKVNFQQPFISLG